MDTKTDNADKREIILQTTLKLLSERGLTDTPMSLIVRESGVSTGAIYHYFKNKDKLIQALYHEIKSRMVESLLFGYVPEASCKEKFLYLWKTLVKYNISHPMEIKFLEQYENSPYYDVKQVMEYHKLLKPALSFFEKGKQEKILKDLPLEILMEMGMAVGVSLVKQHLHGSLKLTEELIDASALACWDAVKR